MTKLQVGDVAPDFTATTSTDAEVSLSDFAGGRVIVYFYPAAMTSGCTTEAVDFSSSLDEFTAAGFTVVGVSPDKPEKLARFRDKNDLRVVLLSDPDRDILKAYGAFGEKKLYGKVVEGVIRSTFAVDVASDGIGKITLAQYNVRAKGHVDKLKRDLGIAI